MGFMRSFALSITFLLFHSLFITSTFINCFHFAQPSQCHEDESHALLQFKEDFVIRNFASSDPLSYPKTSYWNASTNCCSWDGIECDESTGHVIGIDVSNSQLYGSMDANISLFSLVHLQSLNLGDNHFNFSQIPSKMGELSQLRYLNLSFSVFSGEIPPQVSQLSKLLSLDLSYNYESSGNVKSTPDGDEINLLQLKPSNLRSIIKNSTKLEVLLLDDVSISSRVPHMLANLTSLQTLSLYKCDMYGEFPVGIFHLPNLRYLNLQENQNLTGRLPDFQSNSLTNLQLDDTGFYGSIPASIGKLSSLNTLSIHGCSFFGSLPSSLGNLTQLTQIYLGHNNFTVDTFSWIGKLSSIYYLDVSSLNIGSEIPLSFANLTQLQYLYAIECNLTGEIPSWIMNLTNLAYLDLYLNNLQGEIPYSFFRLENLEFLRLSNNSLHGNLELDMCMKFKKLNYLGLSFNKLSLLDGKSSSNWSDSGILILELASCNLVEFPTFIRYLGDLGGLYLSYNSIASLPSWLWTKASLQSLNVHHNSLTGEISPSICNLKSLMSLDLSFNNLSDRAPSCLGNFSQSLKYLKLKVNNLSGPIPQTYLIGNTLQMIDFSNNNLQGQLPRELVNCGKLEYFDVSHNNINDSFPFWLGDLPELKVLALRGNQFHGAIRCLGNMTGKFPKLHIIDLSHNEFSGSFPSEMIQSWESMKASNISQLQYYEEDLIMYQTSASYFVEINTYAFIMSNKGVEMVYPSLQEFYYMIAIDISNNKISGEIPKVIGDLTSLYSLNLSNNMLTGSIPSSLGKLSNLEALDLSLNSLSGQIPQQLTQLTFLEFFNVSFNNLSGPIPQSTQFSTFQGNLFEGNQGLCGDQLLKKCAGRPSLAPPSASDVDEDSDSFIELDWKIVFIGYAGGLVAGVALGITFSPEIFRWFKRFF